MWLMPRLPYGCPSSHLCWETLWYPTILPWSGIRLTIPHTRRSAISSRTRWPPGLPPPHPRLVAPLLVRLEPSGACSNPQPPPQWTGQPLTAQLDPVGKRRGPHPRATCRAGAYMADWDRFQARPHSLIGFNGLSVRF